MTWFMKDGVSGDVAEIVADAVVQAGIRTDGKAVPERHNRQAIHGRWYGDASAAAFALELMGERWSLLIVREMMLGARRFNELRAALPGLSAKTLTERLETLEGHGIVARVALPRPVSAQAYGLTKWGRGLEEVLQALDRWALRSPEHDASLPLSPVSFLLSLRTMLDRQAIGDLDAWISFDIADQHFAGRLRAGDLTIHPAASGLSSPDLRFCAPSANALLPLFFGDAMKVASHEKAMVEGDPALLGRFLSLFELPPKNTL